MLLHLKIILVIALNGQLGSEANDFINLIDVLVRDGGQWILAAAASTWVPPPYKSCVNITVKLLRSRSECIISNLNLTVHNTRHIGLVGQNEDGDVEIRTKGPIHQYTIKRRDEKQYLTSPYRRFLNEVDWEAAVNQAICWKPRARPYQFVKYRYVVTPVTKSLDVLYLVGVKQRWPVPEYEVALFTKYRMYRSAIEYYIKIINWKNFDKMEGCREEVGHGKLWPPVHKLFPEYLKTIPYYWTYWPYCLPRLHIKCAKGYDILDMNDPVNHVTPHKSFNKSIPYFYSSKQTETVYALHDVAH